MLDLRVRNAGARSLAGDRRWRLRLFRNPTAHPTAHEARVRWPMSKADAKDTVSVVSLIHRWLDASHMPARH